MTARSTASSPSASDGSGVVLIGNPDSNRVALFQQALMRAGQAAARVVAWADLLADRLQLSQVVRAGDHVRIESPGRDWDIERALLRLGALHWAEEDTRNNFKYLGARQVEALEFDKGRIHSLRQWFVGWREALRLVQSQLDLCAPHRVSSPLGDIAIMFDKPRCHSLLGRGGVSVPRSLGTPRSFDDLCALMAEAGCRRVFVKPAHGSSASGVVALRSDGRRFQATTATEMMSAKGEAKGETVLYNSRRIRVYEDLPDIRALINALCRHNVYVEEWIPKAGFMGKTCDLRVVVIGGQARHTVARLSRHPMTNLHLQNERGDVDALRERVGPESWGAAMQACEKAMTCFPQTLCGGVDLLLTPGFARHAVLEVNAFGDLLPGVLHRRVDTYGAQVQVLAEASRC